MIKTGVSALRGRTLHAYMYSMKTWTWRAVALRLGDAPGDGSDNLCAAEAGAESGAQEQLVATHLPAFYSALLWRGRSSLQCGLWRATSMTGLAGLGSDP